MLNKVSISELNSKKLNFKKFNLKNLTIKWKLITLIVSVSIFVLILASSAILAYRIIGLRDEMVANNRTHAGILANSVVYALSFNDTQDGTKVLAELQWHESVDLAAIYDNDGDLFAQYRQPRLSPNLIAPEIGERNFYFTGDHLVLFHPVFFHNERIGTVCLMANLDRMYALIQESILVVFMVFLCSTLISLIMATQIQRYISTPILALAEAAKEVAERKDYTIQVYHRSSDELGELIEEFNQMLRKIRARDAALVEAKERLEKSGRELASHRDHLEKLVEERTANLKNAYEEIRAFVFMFSHDLRTPLVNIKGFSGELRQNLNRALELFQSSDMETSPNADEFRELVYHDIPEALSFIEKATGSMDNLINAILKLSFLGRRVLNIESVKADRVVKRLIATTLEGRESEAEITVGELPNVKADLSSFEQIMGNILSNAVAYLQPGRKGKIHIWGEEGDGVVFYHVKDNGRGIETEDIPRVFEPFRRLGSKGIEGEGMGMVYAKTLVSRHGGRLWCVSSPGKGSTFTFTISSNPDFFDTYSPLGI